MQAQFAVNYIQFALNYIQFALNNMFMLPEWIMLMMAQTALGIAYCTVDMSTSIRSMRAVKRGLKQHRCNCITCGAPPMQCLLSLTRSWASKPGQKILLKAVQECLTLSDAVMLASTLSIMLEPDQTNKALQMICLLSFPACICKTCQCTAQYRHH